MAWGSAIFGIFGSLVGAAVSPLLQQRSARRTRLEDAYIDLAGAATLLMRLSMESAGGKSDRADEAWVRYGAARARVLLQDADPECHKEVVALSEELENLYAIAIGLGGSAATGEAVAHSEEHLAKMKRVERQVDKLLHCARRQMRARLLQ
jgi:hypothetical protein